MSLKLVFHVRSVKEQRTQGFHPMDSKFRDNSAKKPDATPLLPVDKTVTGRSLTERARAASMGYRRHRIAARLKSSLESR